MASVNQTILVPGGTGGAYGGRVSLAAPLFVKYAADMTVTTDQSFVRVAGFTNWIPTYIVAIRASGAFGTACAGGIYTAAGGGGTAIVAAGQSWANLTGSGKIVIATLNAGTTDAFTATPILTLTTGNTGALTANLYVFGLILD
jgi:hypothetical protein